MVAAYRRTHSPKAQVGWLGLRVDGRLALGLHSSNEPSAMMTAL